MKLQLICVFFSRYVIFFYLGWSKNGKAISSTNCKLNTKQFVDQVARIDASYCESLVLQGFSNKKTMKALPLTAEVWYLIFSMSVNGAFTTM